MLQASLSHDPVDLHGRLDVGCWAWQVASSAFLSEPHSSCWVISELRFSLVNWDGTCVGADTRGNCFTVLELTSLGSYRSTLSSARYIYVIVEAIKDLDL